MSFHAFPATLRPATPVALRPVFTRGSGRVEPDVGTVESGGSYLVGPFTTARTYTLAGGSVLVAGGRGLDRVTFAEIEIFDPVSGQ